MPKLNFNPKNESELYSFLESLNTPDQLLEHSALIYGTESSIKNLALENTIRFGNLSLEELQREQTKVNTLVNHALENNIPVSESNQRYLLKMTNVISNKIEQTMESNYEIDEELSVLETQQFDMNCDNFVPTIESINIGELTSLKTMLESISTNNKILPSTLLETCRNYFCCDLSNDTTYPQFKETITDKVLNTLIYQTKHESYHDLPIRKAVKCVRTKLQQDFYDEIEVRAKIDDLFDSIDKDMDKVTDEFMTGLDTTIKNFMSDTVENFNPNPFHSIYNMTPLSVGTRTVSETINKCLNAPTDEILVEGLNEFAVLMTICESYGEEIIAEDAGSAMNKAKRAMARTSKKVVDGAKKVQKGAQQAKDTTKRIVDPMSRFVEDTYDKIAKSDLDERKKAVLAVGMKGKVSKILKWIKDVGIIAIAGGASASMGFGIGTVIAAIALVGYIAKHANLDGNARKQVIADLETELRITREKIEDARGDENKQKKYELMRIEDKLEKELNRIKLYQKY